MASDGHNRVKRKRSKPEENSSSEKKKPLYQRRGVSLPKIKDPESVPPELYTKMIPEDTTKINSPNPFME